jgi:hypothetical protein
MYRRVVTSELLTPADEICYLLRRTGTFDALVYQERPSLT